MSVVECFAASKRGYCEHYATLMTVLLREHDIPARFVEGFLPGTLDKRTGVEQVFELDAHAWVEVYFPGYGWYMFDPTGNGQDATVPLPSGKPVASAPPSRFPSLAPSRPTIRGDNDRSSRGAGSGRRIRRRRRRRAGWLHPDRGGAARGDRRSSPSSSGGAVRAAR